MTADVLPDQTHIERIREHLWRDREFGQAAVMVGAGFSRNAQRRSTAIPVFPLWPELGGLIYDSLYPPGTVPDQDREASKLRATAGGEVLKLAGEYEAQFGSQALDALLLKSIPDSGYYPGRLHEMLLSLPWSDVFTTNYDTLLERTRPAVYDRKYDLVLTPSDIPGKMKPRIVKLHGSFPSHRPFIITEEDYRTYPRDFAPFVNLVQQSLMENIFCLIGFSGDDPNFLYWSGWVRDNLGQHAPPIYLCGLLDLSVSQRRVLEKRNVVPIDLSPIFPVPDWPDSQTRHAKAMEWFLCTLMNGAPPNIMRWPNPAKRRVCKPSEGLPPIPPGPDTLPGPGKLSPDSSSLQRKDLELIHATWREIRLNYPGWVVAPQENRDTVWRYTEQWIEPLLDSIEELDPPDNLFLSRELIWRLEVTLVPLWENWIETIARVTESYNPYPKLIELDDARIKPDENEYRQLDWGAVAECWVELAFALAREARDDQDEARFSLWMGRLKNVIKRNAEWQARWFYEECLFNLFRFDQDRVRATLEAWPEKDGLPFWEVKRAAILAELGGLEKAEEIAERALTEIRSRIQPYSNDYSLLSQEGWTMALLKMIKDNRLGDAGDIVGEYRDRWGKLRAFRCDPWPEIRTLKAEVHGPRPRPKPEKEIKKGFDPGRVRVTYSFSSGLFVDNIRLADLRPAFAFLRIFEEGALPAKCGMVDMDSDTIMKAAQWVARFVPFWSLGSMIRGGKREAIQEWFTRVRVATLSRIEVEQLGQIFVDSLRQGIEQLAKNPDLVTQAGNYSRRQVVLISELLSRLCIRFSAKQLDPTFKLAVYMYKHPLFRQNLILHDPSNIVLSGTLKAMPQPEILERIPELLSLPIPNVSGFEVGEPQLWNEPFEHVEWLKDTRLDPAFDRSSWAAPIAGLIRVVEQGSPEARGRAVIRLAKLHDIDGLTEEEQEAFGKALWSRLDPDTGLPSETGLLNSSFLFLPETETGKAKQSCREYLLSEDFPRIVQYSTGPNGEQSKSITIGSEDNRYIREWLQATVSLFASPEEEKQRIDWSADEAAQLLEKAAAWWDEEKAILQEDKAVFRGYLRNQFSQLVPLLSRVVLPRLGEAEESTKSLAKRLLAEMEDYGISIYQAWPMVLFIEPTLAGEVARKLRDGLNSMREGEVRDSCIGIRDWTACSVRGKLPVPPPDLLNELVNRIVGRRQPGLNPMLGVVVAILERAPQSLTENHIEDLCVGLEYLLEETEIPDKEILDLLPTIRTAIPVEDRPEARRYAARLAFQLFLYFADRGEEPPDILNEWKVAVESDPLPEVRRAWRNEV